MSLINKAILIGLMMVPAAGLADDNITSPEELRLQCSILEAANDGMFQAAMDRCMELARPLNGYDDDAAVDSCVIMVRSSTEYKKGQEQLSRCYSTLKLVSQKGIKSL